MAVTQKISYVIEKIREEFLSYVDVYDGATLLHKIECETSDEAIIRLEEWMESVEGGGYVTLKLKDKPGKEIAKGGKINAFSLRIKLGGVSDVAVNGGGNRMDSTVISMMQKNFDLQLNHLTEKNDLLKRIEALENKKKDKPDMLETAIGSLLPMLVGSVNGKMAVNGNQSFSPPTPALADDVSGTNPKERLRNALEVWGKSDPDYITVIENIATLVTTNRPKYDLAKGML